MSVLSSSTRQAHTILGGGIRYETVEIILSAIPNFELKQKGRILHLFTEIYNAFIQEIQEVLDEKQNNLDSLLADHQANIQLAEPFAFESQVDIITNPINQSSKSKDETIQENVESETNTSNQAAPLLTVSKEKENGRKRKEINLSYERKPSWVAVPDLSHIKKEAITPRTTKKRHAKTSSNLKQKISSPMRQMTMTQLFDPIESPKSTKTSTPIKLEPNTPSNDSLIFIPESLIGLAQPSESLSDDENEQNNLSDLLPFIKEIETSNSKPLKRKSVPSPVISNCTPDEQITDEEENIQNEALLDSSYSNVNSEQLLYACPMCRNYWLGLPEELRHKERLTCRHRQRPATHTPEHFWSLGIPNTQTCIQRGYGGVLPSDKPIQRPRRPRRQYQRKLQERQQQQQNEDEEEE